MCQEVQMADLRKALVDYCDELNVVETESRVDDLLAQFDDPCAPVPPHALEHRRRGARLRAGGDQAGAEIHRALESNLARAARPASGAYGRGQ